ncbi:hypothetical protein HYW21_03355 [Candidatus Woesearchaeota archaeon]|nr:hypothetical protein [Candidatus Woesearchaeota archaeon]
MIRQKRGKRGQADHFGEYVIVGLVITLVILFIMLKLELSVGNILRGTVPEQICRDSVLAHAGLHIKGVDVSSDIKCPTQHIKNRARENDDALHEIAEAMRKCKWQFDGDGLNLFKNKGVFDALLDKETNYCVVCHRLEFTNELTFTPEEIQNYLMDHTFQRLLDNQSLEEISYYEYLTGISPEENRAALQAQAPSFPDEVITTKDTDLATIFMYNKGGETTSAFWEWTGGGSGALGAVGLGIALFSGVGTIPVLLIIGAGAGTGALAGGAVAQKTGTIEQTANVGYMLVPYTTEYLSSLECDYLPAKQTILSP